MGKKSKRPHPARRRSVWRKAADEKVSAVLITRAADVRYLTGFTGEDGFLVMGDGWACLIIDGRFDEQAERECGGIERHLRRGPVIEALGAVLKGRNVRSLGVQGDHLTVDAHRRLVERLAPKKVKTLTSLVSAARETKDDGEVRAVRRAITVAEKAFRQVFALGRAGWVGRSEREIAGELDYRMRLAGADGTSFDTIVAAGPHASLCHYRPGGHRVRPDEPVLVDWGANVEGYCSDLTRVVFTGRIPPKIAEIHEIVRRAQEAGIAAARPRAMCRNVDADAREVISSAGYGEQFAHGLGHGVGLAVHESPALSRLSEARLRKGMVVTVEPGIYLPGVGGVRIEDDVLITADGSRRLTRLPRGIGAMTLQS